MFFFFFFYVVVKAVLNTPPPTCTHKCPITPIHPLKCQSGFALLRSNSGLMYTWETMEANSPHPLLLQLPWDACGFSLAEMRTLMYKESRRRGQRGKREKEFNCLSCPSLPPTLPCFALNKPLKPSTSPRFATGGLSAPQIGAAVAGCDGGEGYCFIFLFLFFS